MKPDIDRVRREIRRELSADVRAGIGAWSTEASDSELGSAQYEYRGDQTSVSLYDLGMRVSKNGVSLSVMYDEIRELLPLHLKDLVRVRDPNARVEFTVRCDDRHVVIDVPLVVYSALYPTLAHIIAEFGSVCEHD